MQNNGDDEKDEGKKVPVGSCCQLFPALTLPFFVPLFVLQSCCCCFFSTFCLGRAGRAQRNAGISNPPVSTLKKTKTKLPLPLRQRWRPSPPPYPRSTYVYIHKHVFISRDKGPEREREREREKDHQSRQQQQKPPPITSGATREMATSLVFFLLFVDNLKKMLARAPLERRRRGQ